MKDPQIYLRKLGVPLTCPVTGGKAILDQDFRAFVNHEVFFFASREAREQFESKPFRYCGLVTDPVNETRFRPTKDSPRYDHRGRPYVFTSEETRATFKKDPERYQDPRRVMKAEGPASQPKPTTDSSQREP